MYFYALCIYFCKSSVTVVICIFDFVGARDRTKYILFMLTVKWYAILSFSPGLLILVNLENDLIVNLHLVNEVSTYRKQNM